MDRNIDVLVVATVDYTPHALATLRSAREHGQYQTHHVFVLDAPPQTADSLRSALGEDSSWIHVFGPHDLGPERDTFLSAFAYYSPIEMCCLAKYVGVSHVLRTSDTAEVCIYSDADILFFGDIREALSELGDKAFLLTPHQFGSSNDAAEHDYLLHGAINAGFFAVRRAHPDTEGLISWLIHRISRRGFLATQYGLSCDQTWLSLLPVMFGNATAISRHPGMNVAYWNLFQRKLEECNGKVLVNGFPLIFFHFSGFSDASATQLSKHAHSPAGSVLMKLCQKYQSALNAVERISASLATLPTLPCSRASLQERIYIGSMHNDVSIESTATNRGFFARAGMRVDALLHRLTGL